LVFALIMLLVTAMVVVQPSQPSSMQAKHSTNQLAKRKMNHAVAEYLDLVEGYYTPAECRVT
jgi:Tfp pilus assembly protein PilX